MLLLFKRITAEIHVLMVASVIEAISVQRAPLDKNPRVIVFLLVLN